MFNTGVAKRVLPRLRECSRQVEAEVVSNSSDKIHQTWPKHSFGDPCRACAGSTSYNLKRLTTIKYTALNWYYSRTTPRGLQLCRHLAPPVILRNVLQDGVIIVTSVISSHKEKGVVVGNARSILNRVRQVVPCG